MYEVGINARPERLLRWEKPLLEQSEPVRRALGWTPSAEAEYRAARSADTDNLLAAFERNVPYNEMKMPPSPKGTPSFSSMPEDILKPGRELQARAAQELSERGIPGVQYLDQGSRGAGSGTSNYVVFDPKNIDILRRYANGGNVGE